jgi:hypothetical protein
VNKSHVEDANVHHSFTVTPDTLVQACKVFSEKKIPIDRLYYRAKGFFHRERTLFLRSKRRTALRVARSDMEAGMPEQTFEELAKVLIWVCLKRL